MTFRIIVISFIVFITFSMVAIAQSPTDTMLKANQLYEAGKYDQAIETYQTLITDGVRDSAVFYNLGNAYFKQGDLGQAILNYRFAEKMSPRDADIQANLALARSQTKDQINIEGELFLSRLTKLTQRWLTVNEMAIIALNVWFFLALFFIIYSHVFVHNDNLRLVLQYTLISIAVFLVFSITLFGMRLYEEITQPQGVIIASAVDITSGPGDQYVTEFTLHSGTEVRVIEVRKDWVRLTLPGNQLIDTYPISW